MNDNLLEDKGKCKLFCNLSLPKAGQTATAFVVQIQGPLARKSGAGRYF